MQERVLKNKKIEVIWNSAVEEIIGEKRVEGIKLKLIDDRSLMIDKKSKTQIHHPSSNIHHLDLDGVFVAIGHKPDTDLFKDQIELDEKGYIIVNKSMTSVPGVFAAGDCVDNIYQQAATAVGMGVAAALDVEKYLETLEAG
jgi:thioredoxin reductase (NADPH)